MFKVASTQSTVDHFTIVELGTNALHMGKVRRLECT